METVFLCLVSTAACAMSARFWLWTLRRRAELLPVAGYSRGAHRLRQTYWRWAGGMVTLLSLLAMIESFWRLLNSNW